MSPDDNIPEEIDTLSNHGYSMFPRAEMDVVKIKKKFYRKHFPFNSNTLFYSLLLITMIGFIYVVIINKSMDETHLFPPNKIITIHLKPSHTKKNNNSITIHKNKIRNCQKSNFVNLERREIETECLPIHQIRFIATEINDPCSLQFSDNAHILFLHDRKIANYYSYYFQTRPSLVEPKNTEAIYENQGGAVELINVRPLKEVYLNKIIENAMCHLKSFNYVDALEQLQMLINYNPDDLNAQFYSGICFFHLKMYNNAVQCFKLSKNHSINVFQQEADYYYALSLKETGNTEESLEILKQIASEKGFYTNKALQLLK